VLVFIKVIPALISFLVIAALVFLVFRYFESEK
jgi:hypothetical protein